jgi:hypothetical protein
MAEAFNQDNLFQYAGDQVSLTWINQELTDALPSQDGVINISLDNEQYELLPDGLGGWIYKSNVNSSGTCQVTLDGAHPRSQFLFRSVVASRSARIVTNGPLYLNDQWNKMKVLMNGAIITKYPDLSRGANIGPNLWIFRFGEFRVVPNLKRTNQIG